MADYAEDKKILGLDPLTGAQVAAGDGFVVGDASDSGKAKYVLQSEMLEALDVTASAAELNILDGATLSTVELNYVDGVTSAIQTQLDTKAATTDLVSVYVTVRNATGSTIAKGKPVYISGATGQTPTIALGRANALATSKIIGFTNQSIANNTTVVNGVTALGTIDGIDTSAFADGAQLYLSETVAGEVQSTAPSSPNFTVPVGIVLHSHLTQGKIEVHSLQTIISENTTVGTNKGIAVSENVLNVNLAAKEPLKGADDNYVTDAEKIVIGNTSGTNTGDNATNSQYSGLAASKQDTLVSATNIKTINSNSILGSGNLVISGSGSDDVLTLSASTIQTNISISANTSAGVTSILRVTPTAGFSLQSIDTTSWPNGKKLIIENVTNPLTSAACYFIIENQNGASGTKFSYPFNGVPLFMGGGETATFVYNSTSGYLELVNASCFGSSNSEGFDNFCDFVIGNTATFSNYANFLFLILTGGSAETQTTLLTTGSIKPVGAIDLRTASSATGRAELVNSTSGAAYTTEYLGIGSHYYLARATPSTALSDGSQTYKCILGGYDATTPTDGIFWEYDQSNSVYWNHVTVSNSNVERVATTLTVSITQMPYLGIFVNGDGSKVYFFYSGDGVSYTHETAHSDGTKIPTGTSRVFSYGALILKSVGTTLRALTIDLIGLKKWVKRGS